MKDRSGVHYLAALPLLAVAGVAEAHSAGGAASGLMHGFAHPFLGLDHVLAMLAVGLWAGQLGGRALWQVPGFFLALLAVGGALGVAGLGLPLVEPGIVASLIVLGLLVAAALRLPAPAGLALTGAFALLHGHAHGTEMIAGASALAYALGFLLASTVLHTLGLAASRALGGKGTTLVRAIGAGIATTGLVLLAA